MTTIFNLQNFSGGMSNVLFCCSLPESYSDTKQPSQVLLRFYGDEAKNSNISIQLEIFSLLSAKNLGPKLYGKFDDGRLEEFLPAESLTSEELIDAKISNIIAKKIAAIHNLEFPKINKNSVWLKDKFLELTNFIENSNKHNSQINGTPPSSTPLTKATRGIAKDLLAIDYQKEIRFLNGLLNETQSPVVFSHNDLHQGNILLAKLSKKRPTLNERIVFIDFEYCSYNYRAYDIANHFCEWSFQYDTPDYPHFDFFQDRIPDESRQLKFVENYLEHQKQLNIILKDSNVTKKKRDLKQAKSFYLQFNGGNHFHNNGNLEDLNADENGHHFHDHDQDYHMDQNHETRNNRGHFQQNGNGHGNGFSKGYHKIEDKFEFYDNNNNENQTGSSTSASSIVMNGQNHHSNGTSLSTEVLELYEEIQPFFMMANFLWTLWCIKSAQTSTIKFGYWVSYYI